MCYGTAEKIVTLIFDSDTLQSEIQFLTWLLIASHFMLSQTVNAELQLQLGYTQTWSESPRTQTRTQTLLEPRGPKT